MQFTIPNQVHIGSFEPGERQKCLYAAERLRCAFIFLCIINQMISNMEKEQYSSPCVKMLDVLLSYSLLDASGGGHDWNDTGDE